MSRVTCPACRDDVEPSPPSAAYWALIVSFWIASFIIGGLIASEPDGHVTLVVTWMILAATTSALARHASTWTCPECGVSIAPPVHQHA
jgi:hypothetical protein